MADPTQTVSKRPALHTLVPALLILTGAVLMAYMVYAEGEPGGLPLLLIAIGVGSYLVARIRIRPQTES